MYTDYFASFTSGICWANDILRRCKYSRCCGQGRAEPPSLRAQSEITQAEPSPSLQSLRSLQLTSLWDLWTLLHGLVPREGIASEPGVLCCAGQEQEHSLLSDSSSRVEIAPWHVWWQCTATQKCAQSINGHPAHQAAGKIKPDKSCCVKGNSMEGQPPCSWIWQPKLSAACTGQRREARGSSLSIPPSTTKKEA